MSSAAAAEVVVTRVAGQAKHDTCVGVVAAGQHKQKKSNGLHASNEGMKQTREVPYSRCAELQSSTLTRRYNHMQHMSMHTRETVHTQHECITIDNACDYDDKRTSTSQSRL